MPCGEGGVARQTSSMRFSVGVLALLMGACAASAAPEAAHQVIVIHQPKLDEPAPTKESKAVAEQTAKTDHDEMLRRRVKEQAEQAEIAKQKVEHAKEDEVKELRAVHDREQHLFESAAHKYEKKMEAQEEGREEKQREREMHSHMAAHAAAPSLLSPLSSSALRAEHDRELSAESKIAEEQKKLNALRVASIAKQMEGVRAVEADKQKLLAEMHAHDEATKASHDEATKAASAKAEAARGHQLTGDPASSTPPVRGAPILATPEALNTAAPTAASPHPASASAPGPAPVPAPKSAPVPAPGPAPTPAPAAVAPAMPAVSESPQTVDPAKARAEERARKIATEEHAAERKTLSEINSKEKAQSIMQVPLQESADDWQQEMVQDHMYWVNHKTNQAQWDKPKVVMAKEDRKSESDKNSSPAPSKAKETVPAPLLPHTAPAPAPATAAAPSLASPASLAHPQTENEKRAAVLIKGLMKARERSRGEPEAVEEAAKASPQDAKSSASRTALEQEQDHEFNNVAILASIGGIGVIVALAFGRSFYLSQSENDEGPEP